MNFSIHHKFSFHHSVSNKSRSRWISITPISALGAARKKFSTATQIWIPQNRGTLELDWTTTAQLTVASKNRQFLDPSVDFEVAAANRNQHSRWLGEPAKSRVRSSSLQRGMAPNAETDAGTTYGAGWGAWAAANFCAVCTNLFACVGLGLLERVLLGSCFFFLS